MLKTNPDVTSQSIMQNSKRDTQKSFMHLKEELVLKIAILAERFRSEHEWYVDVILSLVKSAGD